MGKLIINDKELEFKPNQTIIEVATENGIDIPHFCWHPSLSVSGNCRMCLVEVEKMPKLVIACSTYATDGMVVRTDSQKSVDARKSVMEFLLINHPLDCPICDEAGECKLQDYSYQHSIGESRFVEEKQHNKKRVELGPRIMFDAERCISCSRCIRFSDEIAKKNQLTFVKRGDRVTVSTFPDETFDNNYTLNTTDICPVGALTNKDFRFKSRVWEMSSTDSICTGCSRGCNTEVWVRNNEILRLTPRYNQDVNSYWMCDKGRLNTFKFVNSSTRIDGCYEKKQNSHEKISWEEAVNHSYNLLKSFKADEIAFIGSAFATLEDTYAMQKFAKSMGINNIVVPTHFVAGDCDDILLNEDKTPNYTGVNLLGLDESKTINYDNVLAGISSGKIKAVVLLDEYIDIELAKTSFNKLKTLIVIASNSSPFTEIADMVFAASTFAEKNGTFVNFNGIVQRINPAVTIVDEDRALDNFAVSRWDKFGTKFDRWKQGKQYDCKPIWKIFAMLSNHTANKMKYAMSEEVFNDIAKNVKGFEGIDYDVIGSKGAKVKNFEKLLIKTV